MQSILPGRSHARYTRVAVLLHWLVAAAVIAQIVLGWWMQEVPKSPPGVRAEWFNLHKSIGLSIAAVLLVRIAWRVSHVPPADHEWPRWQRLAARANHAVLYACLVAMPLSGYLGSAFNRYPVKFFGVALPRWLPEWSAGKDAMAELHLAIAWVFMLAIAAHVAAAIWHAWRRDGVWSRMRFEPLQRLSGRHG